MTPELTPSQIIDTADLIEAGGETLLLAPGSIVEAVAALQGAEAPAAIEGDDPGQVGVA